MTKIFVAIILALKWIGESYPKFQYSARLSSQSTQLHSVGYENLYGHWAYLGGVSLFFFFFINSKITCHYVFSRSLNHSSFAGHLVCVVPSSWTKRILLLQLWSFLHITRPSSNEFLSFNVVVWNFISYHLCSVDDEFPFHLMWNSFTAHPSKILILFWEFDLNRWIMVSPWIRACNLIGVIIRERLAFNLPVWGLRMAVVSDMVGFSC